MSPGQEPVVKRLVCLANSRKTSGRCVAGKEWSGEEVGAWVRPVSARPHEEVSEDERQYEDGSDPRVLDVMEVPLRKHSPKDYQTENWLLDPEHYWKRVGRVTWDELEKLKDAPSGLWLPGCSSYNGQHDRVELEKAEELSNSLYLVGLDAWKLRVFAPGLAFGNPKRRVQAVFSYQDCDYALWVTDPLVAQAYLSRDDGDYLIGESFLTVSLAEPFEDGYCYKVVATVITPERAGRGS